MIAILVNHSLEKSNTFVLQVPNYEPFVDLINLYGARDIVNMMVAEGSDVGEIKDVEIVHVGKWKLQGLLADKMYSNGVFVVGDAAHAYPPAGGFGMNSGFQDIHELAHSLLLTTRNP